MTLHRRAALDYEALRKWRRDNPKPVKRNKRKGHTMRKFILRIPALACFAFIAVHCLTGCATDPTTGKTKFDPAQAQAVISSQPIQNVAHSIPFGLGDLALAAVGAGLYAYSNKGNSNQVVAQVATHAITAATQAAATSITASLPQTPALSEIVTPAVTPAPAPKAS